MSVVAGEADWDDETSADAARPLLTLSNPWGLDLKQVAEMHGRPLVGLQLVNERRLPDITFVVTDDQLFGARNVLVARGEYRIELRAGTPLLIAGFVGEMFAQRRAFPSTGNPTLEQHDAQRLTRMHSDMDEVMRDEPEALFSVPRCPERQGRALTFINTALRVILAHEIVHALHGHTAIIAATPNPPGLERAELVALEFDADQCAVGRLIQQYAQLRPAIDPHVWVRDLAAGVYIPLMFPAVRNFGDYYDNSEDRQHASLRMLVDAFQHYTTLPVTDDIKRIAFETMVECEAARGLVVGDKNSPGRIEQLRKGLQTAELPEHIVRAADAWASIRDQLLEHAHTSIPPRRSGS